MVSARTRNAVQGRHYIAQTQFDGLPRRPGAPRQRVRSVERGTARDMEDHGKAVCRGKSCPPLGAPGAVACGGAVVPMTLASWNARGLFMAVGQCAMPRRKMSVLRALAESDVAILVESHGEGGDIATLRAGFPDHHVFAS